MICQSRYCLIVLCDCDLDVSGLSGCVCLGVCELKDRFSSRLFAPPGHQVVNPVPPEVHQPKGGVALRPQDISVSGGAGAETGGINHPAGCFIFQLSTVSSQTGSLCCTGRGSLARFTLCFHNWAFYFTMGHVLNALLSIYFCI